MDNPSAQNLAKFPQHSPVKIIRGGTLVSSCGSWQSDILIQGGKIVSIGNHLPEGAFEIIDAHGLYVLPGIIDTQVHFRDPGFPEKEDLYTGSKAAVAGGVTSFLEMPNTQPPTTNYEAMEYKKKKASEVSLANFNFFAGATQDNLEFLNNVPNIAGIKIFMGSSTGNLLISEDEVLEKIFREGKRLIAVHAEDEKLLQINKKKYAHATIVDHPKIRSVELALKATQKALYLSMKYKRRLHILHITSAEEVYFLSEKKLFYVSAEVTPQNLFFYAPDVYERLGTFAQMNPPIREKRHREALRKALVAGVIDVVATDHAPHTKEEKEQPYPYSPSGMPGVETSLAVMLTLMHEGLWSLEQVVRWMCENPARLFGLKNKGFLLPNYDADLVLVDINKKKRVENGKLYTKVNWSCFDGIILQGWPILTMVNGNVVYREGEFFENFRGREIQIEYD